MPQPACETAARPSDVYARGTIMNKNWIGVIGAVIVVLLLLLLVGPRISCYESFWDKDKQVIEIKT